MRRGKTGYQRLATLGLALTVIAALVRASLTFANVSPLQAGLSLKKSLWTDR